MAGSEKKPKIPRTVRELSLGYLNTCVVLARLWRRGMLFLAAALPLAIWVQKKDWVAALLGGLILWACLAAISRCLLFEFRRFRATAVARRIDRRVPRSHPQRKEVIDWIRSRNDGDYLFTLLKKLGEPLQAAGSPGGPFHRNFESPLAEVRNFAESIFGGQGGDGASASSQTYTYVTTQTQMLKDGEWVTVESSTNEGGSGEPPNEAIQKALAMINGDDAPAQAEPPPDFEPIPLSASTGSTEKKKRRGGTKHRNKRRAHLPLQPDAFQPAAGAEGEESGEPVEAGAERSGRE